MFRRLFSNKPVATPLSGAPREPREKIYSAQSGYVYHYFYRGFRVDERGQAATERTGRTGAKPRYGRATPA
ncbi:MAG: hypothetical protein ABSH56_25420 [Bryobacteraceae bacterium]